MSPTLRKGLMVLLAGVFVVSSLLFLGRLYDEKTSAEANGTAQKLVMPDPGSAFAGDPASESRQEVTSDSPFLPEVTPAPGTLPEADPAGAALGEDNRFLLELDLDALQETSEHVLGWIYIPDTVINYPLMAFDDNETGLNRAWDGTKNSAGSIFLECKNRRDFSDVNTLVYGHHMRTGTMFGSLKHYARQDYLESHPIVYIITDDFVRCYKIFSAYEANVTSDTYRLYFETEEAVQAALDGYVSASRVKTGIVPAAEDRILTLSTCMGTGTYGTRWVVQAVLTDEIPR